MADRKLAFDTPLLLRGGFDVIEADEHFQDHLMGGYKAIANLVEVGGTVLGLDTEVLKASEWPPHTFPPEIPSDTPVYSVHWTSAMTVRQALLFAVKEGSWDFWSDTLDESGMTEFLGRFPEKELELLLDELMESQGETVESWRVWKKKKEEDSY